MVDGDEIAMLEPNLTSPPARAIFAPGEGACDAYGVAQRLLTDIPMMRGKVTSLPQKNGRVIGVVTDQGQFEFDHVVVAAGGQTPD